MGSIAVMLNVCSDRSAAVAVAAAAGFGLCYTLSLCAQPGLLPGFWQFSST
jgi:hypothetical protein